MSSPLFGVLDLLVFLLWLCLFPWVLIGSLPFIVVPHPFLLGEYRVTPSCIVAATALFTVITMINSWFFTPFLLFHLIFFLRTTTCSSGT